MKSTDARAVVDVGATRVKFGYSTDGQALQNTNSYRLDRYRDPGELFATIRDGNPKTQNIPWVVGVPSPVEKNKMADTPNLSSYWKGNAITEALDNLGITYVIENDANLAALGVFLHGVASDCRNVVCLTLGTGIGGGIIIDGSLYRGHSGAAGEVGHLKLVPGGRPCECGNRGCFEQYGSASGLVQTYEQLTGDQLMAEEIADRYPGDESAKKALDATGTHLGRGLAKICNLLEPELFVLAGGLSNAFDRFQQEMRKAFEEEVFAARARRTDIEQSDLDEPALYGGLGISLSSS